MIRKILCICLAMTCMLTGCVPKKEKVTQFQATFLDLFDTVTTIVGYADSEEVFQEMVQPIHDRLLEYHQLFDIYNTYEGINNLKTINDNAGQEAVMVDEDIIALLLDCKEYYEATDGRVNAAMGSVLSLWHESRNKSLNDPLHAELPDMDALKDAAEHISFDEIIIDEEKNTVFIQDEDVRLDVGAIAKGWAAQQIMMQAPDRMLISVGGNVCATGPKDEEGTPWVVGIQNPDEGENEYVHTIYVSVGSVVTSGDYQRVYTVDEKSYHHIVDPETLYPSEYWRSVTIVCEDSGLADMLSTALFLLPLEEGQELLREYEAEAMWVGADESIFYSPGFEELIRT